MSFLLLKSKSRSSRSSTSFRSKQYNHSHSKHQVSDDFSNSNDRNPSIAMKPASSTYNSRRYSNAKEIHVGDGQVQLQRPQTSRQQQINGVGHRQQHGSQIAQQQHQSLQQANQQSQQNQSQNDVISMDEG